MPFLVPYEVPVAEESTCKYTLFYSYKLAFLSVALKLRFEKICKEIIRLASWHQNHIRARNHFALIYMHVKFLNLTFIYFHVFFRVPFYFFFYL